MRFFVRLSFSMFFACFWGVAPAEPLVKMEGGTVKPGVIVAWTSSGTKVELTVREGADAKAVADTIQGNVDKVKAKPQGGKVVVIGKTESELLKLLAEVDLGGDDLGALAMAGMEGDDADSGSSLRAKKTVDLAKMFKDQAVTAMGTVVEVSGTRFPHAEVTVNVLRAPTGEMGKDIRKGKKIKFKALLKLKGQEVDWADDNTELNVGAWYLQKGDKVMVKIGRGANGAYDAEVISRQ